MSADDDYTRREVEAAFATARQLFARAAKELSRGAETGGVSPGLAAVNLAEVKLRAGDPAGALERLAEAREGVQSVLRGVRPGPARADGGADISIELVEQVLGAIERVAHRVRNATSGRTSFGAIQTPRSERHP